MLYRALADLELSRGRIVHSGDIFPASLMGAPNLQRLIEMEYVAEASTPPLSVIPGWKKRAAKLASAGVNTVSDLVDYPNEELSKAFRVSIETVAQWKNELLTSLQAPKKTG